MINQLKNILSKIARLRSSDQRWILHQLSPQQRHVLQKHQGLTLLFNALNEPQSDSVPESLPSFCQQLATQPPLFAAIVIEQSSPPWKNLFLKTVDVDQAIASMLNNEVLDIKPLVKQALFQEWEASISFEDFLEENHG